MTAILQCIILILFYLEFSPVLSYQVLEYTETKLYSKYGARKDYFGHAVGVHNDWVISGAYSSSAFQRDAGSAFSFRRNTTYDANSMKNVTSWKEMPYIIGSNIKPHDYFGGSIAVWRHTVVVGAYLDENVGTNSGTAYVFYYHNGEWKEQQKLSSHNAMAADYFGQSVDIFEDTIVVGAYGQADSGYFRGAAYVFERNSHHWTEVAMLRPMDIQDNHMFGCSAAIFNSTIIIGAYGDPVESGSNTGSAYVFEYVPHPLNDTSYEAFLQSYVMKSPSRSGRWTCTQKLVASDARQYSNFGYAVAGDTRSKYNAASSTLVIGANTARGAASGTGAAYVFVSSLVYQYSTSYVDDIDFSPRSWTQQAKLIAVENIGDEHFGSSVAIDQATIVIGAPDDCFHQTDAGAAYVFHGSAGRWEMVKRVVGNDTKAHDHFGTNVNIDGDTIVIGSEQADGVTTGTGAVYIIGDIKISAGAAKDQNPLVVQTKREKDRFVFILSLLPILLVVIPIGVVSFVVYFDRYYARIASVIGGRRLDATGGFALEEYASLHTSSHHGGGKAGRTDLDISVSSNFSEVGVF